MFSLELQMMRRVYADACDFDNIKQNCAKKENGRPNERNKNVSDIPIARNVYECDD